MNTPHDSLLGREVAYPARYDAGLLFPIARDTGRQALGIATGAAAGIGQALPFIGQDRWHAYELSWLDPRGKPVAATATVTVPADSPNLVESKSLKLYLNSLNAHRFGGAGEALATIARDLSACAGARVDVAAGLPPAGGNAHANAAAEAATFDLDALELEIPADGYGPPQPQHLQPARDGGEVAETLHSALLKSNCPVTGQPDWASVVLDYRGPRIDRAGLLRYLVSFRDHAEFHEQCVERIFIDVMARCAPRVLSVEARYTRRGGLDINPWRATPGTPAPAPGRDLRQ